MRIAILGSGSSGNVAYIESGEVAGARARVLVDAGLAASTIRKRLAALDEPVALEQIDAVLITHEHSDHVGCAASLGRPLYAPAATRLKKGLDAARVLADEEFHVGALLVRPVMLPHDAAETVGYVISDARHRVGILTDCGMPDERVARSYAGCDVLVLEANHDPHLLMDGPYPPSLQRRVRGPRGHLSNAQSAEMLRLILGFGPAPRMIIAAHLSQKNNRPALVEAALYPLIPPGTELVLSSPEGAPAVRLPLPSVPASRPVQLGLALAPAPELS